MTTARPQVCHASKFIKVTNPHGYLASSVSAQSSCGSVTCPWVLEAEPGQKINLTLVDFETHDRKEVVDVEQQLDSVDVSVDGSVEVYKYNAFGMVILYRINNTKRVVYLYIYTYNTYIYLSIYSFVPGMPILCCSPRGLLY